MGWSAARKLRRSIDGLTRVLAIELLTAARALDLRAQFSPSSPSPALSLSPATAAVVAGLRAAGVERPGTDRYLAPEIETAVRYVAAGDALRAAKSVMGPLE
jgi:histidine ammonia-lyase